MKSPIAFRDWLLIAGIILLIGLCYILIEQIPFINNFLDIVGNYIGRQSEYIY